MNGRALHNPLTLEEKKSPPDTHKKRTDAQTTAHVREMFSVKFKGKW